MYDIINIKNKDNKKIILLSPKLDNTYFNFINSLYHSNIIDKNNKLICNNTIIIYNLNSLTNDKYKIIDFIQNNIVNNKNNVSFYLLYDNSKSIIKIDNNIIINTNILNKLYENDKLENIFDNIDLLNERKKYYIINELNRLLINDIILNKGNFLNDNQINIIKDKLINLINNNDDYKHYDRVKNYNYLTVFNNYDDNKNEKLYNIKSPEKNLIGGFMIIGGNQFYHI